MKKKTTGKSKAAGSPAILPEFEKSLSKPVYNALKRWPTIAHSAQTGKSPTPVESDTAQSASSADARLTPSHEEIAIRAEALWHEMGCPHGCDTKIWLAAERRLRRELRLEKEEKDRRTLLEQLSLINHVRMDNVMSSLEELYPGLTGRSPTSL